MAVQFILGRSGTGKTSYCIKAIVSALLAPERDYRGLEPENNQPLIFLVPEQATYQAERAILADKKIPGYNRLHVLSFERLQFWLLGKNTARPAISRIGRQMILHRILRDNKSKLKIFGPSATWPGLSQQMAQTITELHQYAKTPDDIDQLLGELQKDKQHGLEARDTMAILKFTDIGLILREYLNFIEGKFLDPDVQLNQSCREVANAKFVKGAKLWVDGFASFTTSELAILTELLKAVAVSQIALCLDPTELTISDFRFPISDSESKIFLKPAAQDIDPTNLFYPTERTYAELVENIKKCKMQLAKPIILDKPVRFTSFEQLALAPYGAGLAHIERNIFKEQPAKISAGNNIRIISAPNARSEAQFVARQIIHLVKEKGYRYRDIAVIASDINSYEHYIRAYFDDYDVPFFIDKRKPLNQHPAVQLICSALQVITGGFLHSDIFAYLKTDLVPIERCDVDLLENYCLAYGIDGNDWQSADEWRFVSEEEKDFDEQLVNQTRQKAINAILKLRDSLWPTNNPAKKITAEDFSRAIFAFLDDLQIHQTLGNWIEQASKSGDYTTVDEHRQFYDKLVNIFDELVAVFGAEKMTCQDYLAIISSAFSQLTLAFIPPTLDQVLVGSIERSRHPNLKAVFLIGATQRQFPVPVGFDNILSEDDRSAAESVNFTLAPAASVALAERQYLAYIAFTRPSELLCVTNPVVDERGSAVVRSQFIDNLQSLFENISEESITGQPPYLLSKTETGEQVHSEAELADILCCRLGKDIPRCSMLDARYSSEVSGKVFSELLDDICADVQFAELGSNVLSAVNYDNCACLDKCILDELFGRQFRSSATKMGTFTACPYQYFARYILELKERKEFKFEPLDLGNFYHRVLDALLKRLNTEKQDFATVQNVELIKFLKEETSKLVQTDSFVSSFVRRSLHNAFIINSAGETLEDCVVAIAQMVRAGSFRPTLSEVSFGQVKDTSDTLGEYAIDISKDQTLSLDGKIDRLDIANIDGCKVAIVFDYKRRETVFSWSRFYYGLDMQLPIYLLAVTKSKDSKIKQAAGAFYIPVEVPPEQSTLDALSDKTDSFNYKAKGIFDGEFFRHLDNITNSGWSKFYSFRITSNDQQYGDYGKSAALKPNHFEKVLEFTEKKIVQLAEEILSGKIEVKPYRLNQVSPCSYCKYKPVCRFDWQINDYKSLESLNKLQVFDKMGVING